MTPFQCDRILVPTDLSPLADSAVRYAHGLAAFCKAELHVLHVARDEAERLRLPAGATGDGPNVDASGALAQILGEPGGVRRVEAVRVAADVPDAIRKYAHDAAIHLIVMSTHGAGPGCGKCWSGAWPMRSSGPPAARSCWSGRGTAADPTVRSPWSRTASTPGRAGPKSRWPSPRTSRPRSAGAS